MAGESSARSLAPVVPIDSKTDNKAAAAKNKKDDASDLPFAISFGEIYEGPLDLLLDLVRKQDIDIYDIPIAKITAQ